MVNGLDVISAEQNFDDQDLLMLNVFRNRVLDLLEEVKGLVVHWLEPGAVVDDELDGEPLFIVKANPSVNPVAMQEEYLQLLIEVLVLLLRAASHMHLLQRLIHNLILLIGHQELQLISLLMLVVLGFVLELIRRVKVYFVKRKRVLLLDHHEKVIRLCDVCLADCYFGCLFCHLYSSQGSPVESIDDNYVV